MVGDQATLEQIADALVRGPGLQPTSVMRDLGYRSDAEIRRLQSKWRKGRVRLVAEAQRRLDAEPPRTLLDTIFDTIGTLWGFVDGLATSQAVRSLGESLDRQARRRAAEEELSLVPRSPIDTGNQEDLDRAIERFEQRPHRSVDDRIDDIPADMTVDKMPLSLRLHAAALMLHEMALSAKQREAAAVEAANGKDRGNGQSAGNSEPGPNR